MAPAWLQTCALLSKVMCPSLHSICHEQSMCGAFARSNVRAVTLAAPGAVEVMHAKRDALARKAEGLIKCKDDFSELSRCL